MEKREKKNGDTDIFFEKNISCYTQYKE